MENVKNFQHFNFQRPRAEEPPPKRLLFGKEGCGTKFSFWRSSLRNTLVNEDYTILALHFKAIIIWCLLQENLVFLINWPLAACGGGLSWKSFCQPQTSSLIFEMEYPANFWHHVQNRFLFVVFFFWNFFSKGKVKENRKQIEGVTIRGQA